MLYPDVSDFGAIQVEPMANCHLTHLPVLKNNNNNNLLLRNKCVDGAFPLLPLPFLEVHAYPAQTCAVNSNFHFHLHRRGPSRPCLFHCEGCKAHVPLA